MGKANWLLSKSVLYKEVLVLNALRDILDLEDLQDLQNSKNFMLLISFLLDSTSEAKNKAISLVPKKFEAVDNHLKRYIPDPSIFL